MTIAWLMLLLGCGGQPTDSKEAEKKTATVVEVVSAGPASVSDYVRTTTVVESLRAADLVPVSAGKVLQVFADEGDLSLIHISEPTRPY